MVSQQNMLRINANKNNILLINQNIINNALETLITVINEEFLEQCRMENCFGARVNEILTWNANIKVDQWLINRLSKCINSQLPNQHKSTIQPNYPCFVLGYT